MSAHEDLIEAIKDAPRRKGTVAFFDLDRTLIADYSGLGLLREQLAGKQLSMLDALQLAVVAATAARGRLAFEDAMGASAMMLEGQSEQAMRELAQRAFRKHWHAAIYPEGYDLVLAHRQRGHRIAIVSSATRYQIEPIASELGIQDIVCTELEVADGRFTGALQGRPCWGAQKLEAARRYLEQHKLAPRSAWFYTDAHEDLPLLEQVGHPVALNPDAKLTAVARRRGWPSARFTSRTRPGAEDLARTVLAFGSFLPALGLGALSWLRNRSMRKAASRTFQTWAELALVMSGIEMNVTGRQYLWMHRPAIFVFNHQSLLDGFILPALIQGQFTVMGKKEAGDVPLIGQTVQAAGFILFDRDDPQKAREAANRAAEVVRDGSSLLISPEGTRSHGNKLQRFKKGAFHIALQTRVPIVPVVIRNATELWPRGSNFLRPGTVDIEVLPPIPTTDWKLETLQQHVDAVRALFLERLGQED